MLHTEHTVLGLRFWLRLSRISRPQYAVNTVSYVPISYRYGVINLHVL